MSGMQDVQKGKETSNQGILDEAQFAFDQQLKGVTDKALDTWEDVYQWRLSRIDAERTRRNGVRPKRLQVVRN